MKLIFTAVSILIFISLSLGQTDSQFNKSHSGIHKVLVLEVLQTTSYTYLLVQEEENSQWLAIPKIEAEAGETYFYQGGNEMRDFKSNQLNRTFESVMFLGGVIKAESVVEEKPESSASKIKSNKMELTISPVEGGITIAELFSNKSNYEGKILMIKGEVTQFSSSIMGKNWIHLQDGTNHLENFDLVVTSNMIAEEGEIVVLEGKITLNKDFGYGYFYDVIMEDGKIIR